MDINILIGMIAMGILLGSGISLAILGLDYFKEKKLKQRLYDEQQNAKKEVINGNEQTEPATEPESAISDSEPAVPITKPAESTQTAGNEPRIEEVRAIEPGEPRTEELSGDSGSEEPVEESRGDELPVADVPAEDRDTIESDEPASISIFEQGFGEQERVN